MTQGLAILLFAVFALLSGALLRFFLHGSKVPYSVALLLLGLLLGALAQQAWLPAWAAEFGQSIEQVAGIEPQLILFLFLPALIFESAFAMEVHLFRRMLVQIALLAVPGLLIATLLTALLVRLALPLDWSWPVALMFGALVSATDPVAVVSLLKEQSSRKRLETLIEGESLLNDGTAIVFFVLFYSMLVGGAVDTGIGSVSLEFLRVVCVGALVGLLVAAAVVFWVGKVFNDAVLETVVTIAAAYLGFIVAEHGFHSSGVVAVVTTAVLLAGVGRTRFSPEVMHYLRHFWEMLAYIFNTLIFLLVGIIIARLVAPPSLGMWLSLLLLYLGVNLIRGTTIALLSPLLARLGIGLTRDKAIVLTWGGLRGAVALALALSVAQQSQIDAEIREQVLFLTAGLVVLTIVINGGTISALLRYLGLAQLPAAKRATVLKAEGLIHSEVADLLSFLRRDELLADADWASIERSLQGLRLSPQFQASDPGPEEDLEIFYKRQLLESERQNYWNQFGLGLLDHGAAGRLVEAVEAALDGTPDLGPRRKLQTLWSDPPWLERLARWGWLHRTRFRHLAAVYGTLRGYLQAQQALLSLAADLAPDPAMAAAAQRQIAANLEQARHCLEQLRREHGAAVGQLETYTALRLLLNRQREAVQHLADEGVLEPAESRKLIERVEQQMFELARGRADALDRKD
ncbi:sodium:proton antiporter [Pseudomonas sp. LPB0260]|uniref:cation:proton antiporter n=1 Tax=Pseudomonas sp. LPB0260 TaxID=2614442 RepID=UPI0015C25A39|nr:sodium:proton antiporter [Pseudomonas sp. LPB0260]QLC73176.1 sodium:proton antiporter [Pseudomonas sp. LPB0260]QLC75950.1 sodium:proton antiporter [Pseudomonas sp. LPB0260]